jgi:hypothetical protein
MGLDLEQDSALCFGSGSCWASRIRIRIQILPSTQEAKKLKKTLISTVLWLHNDLLSVKTDVNIPTGSNMQKKLKKNLFFVGILKATEEKNRIWIRIRSRIQIRILIQCTDPRIWIRTKTSRIRSTDSAKNLDPDPDKASMNPDPQNWRKLYNIQVW